MTRVADLAMSLLCGPALAQRGQKAAGASPAHVGDGAPGALRQLARAKVER